LQVDVFQEFSRQNPECIHRLPILPTCQRIFTS
jgi:hypothetical protein